MSKRPYHHGDLRAAAVAAGLALVREGGEAQLSLRKVAEAAGVTHRAVYNHFDGRDALLRAVAVRGYEALAEAVSGARDRQAFASAYLRFALSEPNLYDVTMSRNDERWDDQDLRAAALGLVAAAREAGCGGEDDIKRLWMLLHGGLSLHRAGALQPRSDDGMLALMLDMIRG